MNIVEPFVRRPVATTLLSIGVALAGAVSFFLLPVSPLPQWTSDVVGDGLAAGREPRGDGGDGGHPARALRWAASPA
jgi:hypothetical protein